MGEPDTGTAAADAPEAPKAEITKAWGGLWAWACSQRLDWDSPKVKLAMREAKARNAGYHDVAVILWRLAWDTAADTSDVLGELSYLNRTATGPKDGPPPWEVLAALKAGDYATARRLEGTESVVPAQRTEAGDRPAETTTEETER